MLVLSCKLGGVRGLFYKIASARGLSSVRAVSDTQAQRVWATREIHFSFFSMELEMVF